MTALPSLILREFRRLSRQPARIVASVATPALFIGVLASGLGAAIEPARDNPGGYAAFLAPGAIVLVGLFSGIFNAIALIEDRQSGLLRSLMAGPTSIATALLARLLVGAAVTSLQCAAFVAFLPLVGVPGVIERLPLIGVAVLSVAITSQALCLSLAWLAKTTAGFHTVMNTLLMPAWLLGGAFFPIDAAAGWLQGLTRINPAAWLVELSRNALLGETPGLRPVWIVGLSITTLSVLLMFLIVRRPRG